MMRKQRSRIYVMVDDFMAMFLDNYSKYSHTEFVLIESFELGFMILYSLPMNNDKTFDRVWRVC